MQILSHIVEYIGDIQTARLCDGNYKCSFRLCYVVFSDSFHAVNALGRRSSGIMEVYTNFKLIIVLSMLKLLHVRRVRLWFDERFSAINYIGGYRTNHRMWFRMLSKADALKKRQVLHLSGFSLAINTYYLLRRNPPEKKPPK